MSLRITTCVHDCIQTSQVLLIITDQCGQKPEELRALEKKKRIDCSNCKVHILSRVLVLVYKSSYG